MKKCLNNIAAALLTFVFLNIWTGAGAASPRSHEYSSQSSFVRPEVVQYKKAFTSGGKRYTIYYVFKSKPDKPTSKYVSEVYFVPDGYRALTGGPSVNDETRPPKLTGIIYHDLPNGGELIGAQVKETFCKGPNEPNVKAWLTKEIILPEDIANGLMDLVKGRTGFVVHPKGELAEMFKGENMIYTTSSELMKEEWVHHPVPGEGPKTYKPAWLK